VVLEILSDVLNVALEHYIECQLSQESVVWFPDPSIGPTCIFRKNPVQGIMNRDHSDNSVRLIEQLRFFVSAQTPVIGDLVSFLVVGIIDHLLVLDWIKDKTSFIG
jgi:hypothetical protein